ncbi:MAG TPA: hypothetical protein VFJ52_10050 [Terriglobia bacterium]|nr:hypothetical protein [Terriglobia bacterium]
MAQFENEVDLAPGLRYDCLVMHRWAHNLGVWIAILVPIFTAFVFIFLPLFKKNPERQEDHL